MADWKYFLCSKVSRIVLGCGSALRSVIHLAEAPVPYQLETSTDEDRFQIIIKTVQIVAGYYDIDMMYAGIDSDTSTNRFLGTGGILARWWLPIAGVLAKLCRSTSIRVYSFTILFVWLTSSNSCRYASPCGRIL
jgi:hypothetical protein